MAFSKALAVALVAAFLAAPEGEAGSLAKVFARSAVSKLLRHDVVRDVGTVARPLARSRHVWRYTSRRQPAIDAHEGLAPGRHMTARATRGRPPSSEIAQQRYGLPTRPEVRETWQLPAGMPVRFTKVLQGSPGMGEITLTSACLLEALIKMTPLTPLVK